MATPGKTARVPTTFKTRGVPTPTRKKRARNTDEIRKTLQEILSLTKQGTDQMSNSRPLTRSSKKKPTAAEVVDISGSPVLRGKKRRNTDTSNPDEPVPKKMAEDKILDAIQAVSNSVSAMECRMKSFSTKEDITNMVGELKEVKEKVFVNSHNIEKLFDLRKSDQDNLLRRVEQIVESKMSDGRGPGKSGTAENLDAERESQYLRSRRSIKIWPISEVNDIDASVRAFFKRYLKVPESVVRSVEFEEIKRVVQPRRSKIQKEVLVRFRDSQTRDVVQSYAANLAEAGGNVGLRLDIPDTLRGLFRRFESHAAALRNRYGTVKRSVRFDDENMSLLRDVKLDDTQWHRLTAQDVVSSNQDGQLGASVQRTNQQMKERKRVLLQEERGEESE